MKNNLLTKVEIICGRVLIAIVITLVLLIGAEMGYRKLTPAFIFRASMWLNDKNYVPRPYVMSVARPGEGINRLGYRGELPTMPKPAGEFRIFFMGSSTIFNGDPPLPQHVQELFRQQQLPQVKVFNFGSDSSNSIQDMIRILLDVADFEPDLIIMYGGTVDLYNGDARPGYPYRYIYYESNPLWSFSANGYQTLPLFLFSSQILRNTYPTYFEQAFFPKQNELLKFLPGNIQDTSPDQVRLDLYFQSLKKSAMLSKMLHAEFMAFLQPLLVFKKQLSIQERAASIGRYHTPLITEEIHKFQQLKQRDTPANRQRFDQEVEYFEKLRAKLFKRYHQEKINFPLVDLTRIFENSSENVFGDFVHLRHEQIPIVALAVFQAILEHQPKLKRMRRLAP